MIEARFDDLTGGRAVVPARPSPSASSRRRGPDEVAGALEAAEAAAATRAVGAGFVAYEAAPGLDPVPRRPGARSGRPVRRPAARLVRAVPQRQETVRRSNRATTRPRRADRPGARRSTRELRPGDRADPRAHRGRRHLPGEPHDPARATVAGRRARALPRPVLAQRARVRGVPERRAVPRALGVAGAVLPGRRRPHHDAADEGHGAARPLARGGRGDPRAPRRPRRRTAPRTR